MARRRLLVLALLAVATHARALDAPIAGDKLTLVWNARLEKRAGGFIGARASRRPAHPPGSGHAGGAGAFSAMNRPATSLRMRPPNSVQ